MKEWRAGSTTVTRTIFDDLNNPRSLFVTTDGTIYIDNGGKGTVEKWALDATKSTVVMNVESSCYGLFVDIVNNLYCLLGEENQVVKQSLNTGENMSKTIIAGNGVCGSDLDMLCEPSGIFVTIELDLYIADSRNDRIQLFQSGQLIGKTVVGDMKTLSIRLRYPKSIVIDADDYLFIVDSWNDRIIRSNSNGFYCVVGCSALAGSTSYQLYSPYTASFDNVGNILVADTYNQRVQKFMLMSNTNGM